MGMRALLERGPVVLIQWENEFGWPVKEATNNIERIIGYSAKELSSGKVLYRDLIHPLDRERVETEVRLAVENTEETLQHEHYRLKHKQGHYIWVSDFTSLQVSKGELRFIGYIQDITSGKEAQIENIETKKRLELVLEGTRLGMWDWNPQTNDVHFNERWATMLGYDYDEIEHNLSTWENKVHPDDLAKCFADITAHMEGKVPFYENIHRMKRKNGSWAYILDRGKIVDVDKDGKPIRFTGTHTDITKQIEAEKAALEASKAKSNFLAKMSHEIRTPLNGIMGVLDLLGNTTLNKDQKQSLDVVRESADLLLVIINDLLDYSKIEAGKLELEHHTFNLKETLRNIYSLFGEKASAKGIKLKLNIEEDAPTFISSDSVRISQVLMNLVSNAVKFTHKGTVSIDVSVVKNASGIATTLFKVIDTGIGIEDVDRVFGEFHQADSSTNRKYGGTGLGLAISKSLVEMLGGKLNVDSNPGSGSTFQFSLDLEISEPLKKELNESTSEATDFELHVLVAEDNTINQFVISKMLNSLGLTFDMANNGLEALEKIKSQSYDLLLTDIHMPEMDGLELALALKDHPINIVALSADVLPEIRKKCENVGVEYFLAKPFKADELLGVLKSISESYISESPVVA